MYQGMTLNIEIISFFSTISKVQICVGPICVQFEMWQNVHLCFRTRLELIFNGTIACFCSQNTNYVPMFNLHCFHCKCNSMVYSEYTPVEQK